MEKLHGCKAFPNSSHEVCHQTREPARSKDERLRLLPAHPCGLKLIAFNWRGGGRVRDPRQLSKAFQASK